MKPIGTRIEFLPGASVAVVSLLDRTTPAVSSHSKSICADVSEVGLSTANKTTGAASRRITLQPVSSTRMPELAAASEQAQPKATTRFLVITPPQIVAVNPCGPPLKLAVFYSGLREITRGAATYRVYRYLIQD